MMYKPLYIPILYAIIFSIESYSTSTTRRYEKCKYVNETIAVLTRVRYNIYIQCVIMYTYSDEYINAMCPWYVSESITGDRSLLGSYRIVNDKKSDIPYTSFPQKQLEYITQLRQLLIGSYNVWYEYLEQNGYNITDCLDVSDAQWFDIHLKSHPSFVHLQHPMRYITTWVLEMLYDMVRYKDDTHARFTWGDYNISGIDDQIDITQSTIYKTYPTYIDKMIKTQTRKLMNCGVIHKVFSLSLYRYWSLGESLQNNVTNCINVKTKIHIDSITFIDFYDIFIVPCTMVIVILLTMIIVKIYATCAYNSLHDRKPPYKLSITFYNSFTPLTKKRVKFVT